MSWDLTGMGAVASIGADACAIFDALCTGRCGVGTLQALDTAKFRAQHAYEIATAGVGRDEPGRASRWLRTAVAQALADAGLDATNYTGPALVGTTLRELRSAELWWREGGGAPLPELDFGPVIASALGTARAHTFANSCAASLCALALATDLLRLDLADTVLVAGSDSITMSTFGMFDRVQSPPPDRVRPFDQHRRGMVMGEGAAAVVLQRPGTHNARVRARVRGVSTNCDAEDPTAPSPASIAAAVRDAYERSGVRADDIDLVMLHGTGTRLNDSCEASALRQVFTGTTADPLMTAIKGATGHTLGGSGLLSLITAVLAMSTGTVPPISGLTEPISEAEGFRLVMGAPAAGELAIAQINAFGLGGINAVAIAERSS